MARASAADVCHRGARRVSRAICPRRWLCADGLAILLVEQLVEKALRHAHWGYIVETGRIPVSAPAEALRDGELVRQVYLGGDARHEETRA